MTDAGDARPAERPIASTSTTPVGSVGSSGPGTSAASITSIESAANAPPATLDERAARRAALRDLAAMIGVEVFY